MSKKLINELLNNSNSFHDKGQGYDLLQSYFDGYPTETLIPLLESNSEVIQMEAIWIISELGSTVCNNLLNFVIPLLKHENVTIRYFAVEIVFSGTLVSDFKYFNYLLDMLEDEEWLIQKEIMSLICNASIYQLESSLKLLSDKSPHAKGIELLLKNEELTNEKIIELLNDEESLIRKYGAIIARKVYNKRPDAINYLINKENHEMIDFALETIK